MKRLTAARILCTAFIAASLAASLADTSAAGEQKEAQNLTGQWTLTTAPEGPHGAVSMALELKHDGAKVTGTLAPPHGGEIALAGEFEQGTLTLADPSSEGVTLRAKLQDDGTLSGYLSSARGDMTWTAQRVKARNR
jgi:hypothetical protein